MTIDSVSQDLQKLEDDVRRLSRDGRQLAEDVAVQARVVEDEAAAAEFLATEQAMENIGSWFGMLSELNGIQVRQLKQLASDGMDTLKRLPEVRSPTDLLEVGFDHVKRRSEHLAEGLSEAVDVMTAESRFLTTTLVEMWEPFFDLVRSDWARR